MAWNALYKWFSQFRKSYYPDCIVLYKNFLYEEWFNTLTDEEKIKEKERQENITKKRIREGEMALERMYAMTNAIKHHCWRNSHRDFFSNYKF